jgi:putative transcriptional regulator
MTDPSDDPKLLTLWALGLAQRAPEATGRARLYASLEAEPYLPFCDELALHVDLPAAETRTLLARCADPKAWMRGTAPVTGYIDFEPGPRVAPLRAGFVHLSGGARLPRHEHLDRELTFVLAGTLRDDQGRRFGAGDAIDMAVGSAHALEVPSGESATVVLLGGRVRSV